MSSHVYVLRYDHRHGCDVSAYASEDAARKARADIALQYAHELEGDDDAERIRELHARGEYDEAATLYLESHGDESLEVHDLEVVGSDAKIRVAEDDTGVVHHAITLPASEWPGTTACNRAFWWTSQQVTFAAVTSNIKAWLPRDQPALTCLECVCVVGAS